VALPKGPMVFLSRFGDTEVVIASLVLFLIFLTVFYFVIRSLLDKLGIEKIFGLSVPLFLSASVVVLIVFSSASSHPLTCKACHPMKNAAKGLSDSKHNGINCIACHKKSNIMGLPIQKFEQARMIFNYVRGDDRLPVSATINNDVCLACHNEITRGVKTRFKVMMSHREVVKAGIYCIECHEDVAHGRKVEEKRTSTMEKCSSCHNDEEASARCGTCHLDSVWLGMKPTESWGINHDENWPKVHGSRSLYICRSCHYEKDCNRCHISVPHTEGWPYIHGEEAKRNPKDCEICHKNDSLCRGCHRITMPHSPAWMALHKTQEKLIGREVCLSCHLIKGCEQCHERHGHRCGNKGNEQQ